MSASVVSLGDFPRPRPPPSTGICANLPSVSVHIGTPAGTEGGRNDWISMHTLKREAPLVASPGKTWMTD